MLTSVGLKTGGRKEIHLLGFSLVLLTWAQETIFLALAS
jgi:hypothetical protein